MTDLAQFPVASGETVTAFALGPLEAWRFNGTETTAADNVDYKFISGFWHLPHRLSRWCKTRLVPETAGDHPFRVSTCGGVNIWVDGVHIVAHEPFARNAAHDLDVLLPLAADGSDVVILLEDMAERDTSFSSNSHGLGPAR